MASIPCAAYQARSIHCNLKRQWFTASKSVSTDSSQPSSEPHSPAVQSADAAKSHQSFFAQLPEKMAWVWGSTDKRHELQKTTSTDSSAGN